MLEIWATRGNSAATFVVIMLHNSKFGANFPLVFYLVNFSDILQKIMLNKRNIFLKQNIPKNVTSFHFIIGKIKRIDLFINKLKSIL